MFQTMMSTPEYRENVKLHLLEFENSHMTLANGIGLRVMRRETPWIRAIVPADLAERLDLIRADVMTLLMDVAETMLSEYTNNDACRIVTTETSAHFAEYDHMEVFENDPFGTIIIYDCEVEDYLS